MPSARATKPRRRRHGRAAAMRNPLFLDLGREKHNGMKWITSPIILALAVFFSITYGAPEHAPVDPWDIAIEAYPDGTPGCHASVVGAMLRVSDLLDDSPYTLRDADLYVSDDPDGMAARMVLDGDIRPPECVGIGVDKAQ